MMNQSLERVKKKKKSFISQVSFRSEPKSDARCFNLTLYQCSQDDSDTLRDKKNAPRATSQQGYIGLAALLDCIGGSVFTLNYGMVSEGMQVVFLK